MQEDKLWVPNTLHSKAKLELTEVHTSSSCSAACEGLPSRPQEQLHALLLHMRTLGTLSGVLTPSCLRAALGSKSQGTWGTAACTEAAGAKPSSVASQCISVWPLAALLASPHWPSALPRPWHCPLYQTALHTQPYSLS